MRALVPGHLQQHESSDVVHQHEALVRDHWIRQMIHRIELAPDKMTLELDAAQSEACKTCEELKPKEEESTDAALPACLYQPEIEQRGKLVILTLAIQIKRLDGRRMLLSPAATIFSSPPGPSRGRT